MAKLIVFTDGASSGIPGPGFAMYVIQTANKATLKQGRVKLDYCTNNEAEYKGVIYALDEIISHPEFREKIEEIEFRLDSNLAVQQLNGKFKVKNANIRGYIFEIQVRLRQIEQPVKFGYIPRELNIADKLKY